MRPGKLLPTATGLLLALASSLQGEEIFIKGGGLKLGVSPEAGGRAVFFGFEDGPNVLKADESLLLKPPPEPEELDGEFPLLGHEVWVGPQDAWWSQQSLHPKRLKKGVGPLDPWLAAGRFKVVVRTESSVVLEGPASPVSGLKFKKSYELSPDGEARLAAEAKNVRDSSVAWGLWSNTRLTGSCRCFAPAASARFRMSAPEPEKVQALGYEIVDGFFSFVMEKPEGRTLQMKAFLNSPQGLLCAFGESFVFVKRFEASPASEVHQWQAPLEIFQRLSERPEENLLELEFHGPFKTLQPGDELSLRESWRLFKRSRSESNSKAQAEELRELLKIL